MVNKPLVLGYSPWGNGNKIDPFDVLFEGQPKNCLEEGFDGIDAFVLWGGTDIHPSFYNEGHHPTSQAGVLPSDRDTFEWKAIKYCRANDIPIIGICRGAQMLCAAAGGTLVQHVSGHESADHLIETSNGSTFMSNSCHHQMMNPYYEDVEFKLLAWSKEKLSKFYHGSNSKMEYSESKKRPEPEAIYFPKLRAIGIQGHPEWAAKDSLFVKQSLQWVKEYLL